MTVTDQDSGSKCRKKQHEWKHRTIIQEYEDNRGGPPNRETIIRKCLKCGALNVEERIQ